MDWLLGALPIALIVLACPIAMFLMMRGMRGGHSGHGGHSGSGQPPEPATAARLRMLEREMEALRRAPPAATNGQRENEGREIERRSS